jgi:sigma-70-like protein
MRLLRAYSWAGLRPLAPPGYRVLGCRTLSLRWHFASCKVSLLTPAAARRPFFFEAAPVSRADGPNKIARDEQDSTDVVADLPSADDDPESSLIKARDRLRVQQLIAALPVKLRETLVLRELEELSYKEIAEVTRAPIGTVMSRLWQARRRSQGNRGHGVRHPRCGAVLS